MRRQTRMLLLLTLTFLHSAAINCAYGGDNDTTSWIIYFSEQPSGDQLQFIAPDNSKSVFSSISLGDLNLIDGSLRCNTNYAAMLWRKKTDWLHGTSISPTLLCIDLRNGTKTIVTDWNTSEEINYSWGTGNAIYYASGEIGQEGIYRFDLSSQSHEPIVKGDSTSSFWQVRVSPFGQKLAFINRERVLVVDLHTGMISPLSIKVHFFTIIEWLSDDTLLIEGEENFLTCDVVTNKTRDLPFYGFNINVSPHTDTILFVEADAKITNIFSIKADGTGLTKLTHQGANDSPSWSPDGQKIVFTSNRDGNWEIYVMNPDGSEQKRLTHNLVTDYSPEWVKMQ